VRNTAGHGYFRAKNLSGAWVQGGDRDLSDEGRVGHEAVEKTASGSLHGYAVISILLVWTDGRTRKVKYEKFRQPCGVQPAACWEARKSSRLKVGEAEYPTMMNQTRSHMVGEEGCSGSCKTPAIALERKIVQVLMEVLVEEDWIWWNAEKNQVASKSGKVTTVLRDGEAILEDGLRVWKPGDDGPIQARVGGANLPIDGGGTGSSNN
jgi:hypothetical protein